MGDMRYDDFRKGATPGRLEPTTFMERRYGETGQELREVSGYGYVPDDLPAGITKALVAAEVQDLLLAAERNLSQLEGLAQFIDNPGLLMGPFAQKEARHSSAIENTFASEQQLALFDLDPTAVEASRRPDVQEVNNYLRALRFGFQSEKPIGLNLVREMHRILLTGATRVTGRPGEFRTTQNAIGDPTAPFADAKFVPPPPSHVMECFSALEKYIHAESDLPRLVRFAIIHYQFECIHPFDDGNGRLGRLLIALQLCKQAQLSLPLVYISGFLERHRDDYYALLYRVSADGAWLTWIRFFLSGVATQAEDTLERAKRLLALRTEYQERVRRKRASAMLPAVVDELFARPAITVAHVAKIANMKANSAGKLVKQLVEHGIVREVTGRERHRVYLAEGILALTVMPLDDETRSRPQPPVQPEGAG